MALGLRRFLKVVAYCEKDTDCVSVLKHNMQKGLLDKAPIVKDVQNFPSDLREVDCVVGSFPCTSLSGLGKHEGFSGESGLFLAMMEVIKIYKPAFCFFENVDNIRHMTKEWLTVIVALDTNGYDSRWTIVAACNVGAPHRRKRWFLLAKHRGTKTTLPAYGRLDLKLEHPWNYEAYRFCRNSMEPDMPRMVQTGNNAIMKMCGNICVPLQAALAFVLLTNKGFFTTSTALKTLPNAMPKTGVFSKGMLWESQHDTLLELRPLELQFYQKYYNKTPKRHIFTQRHPVLREVIRRKYYASPRVCNASWTPSTIFTQRTMRDLGTQMRFERSTNTNERNFRKLNPDFITWLVGLPRNYFSTGHSN